MDDRRKRLLKRKLGDRLCWSKPKIVETIGPCDPTPFDHYETELAKAIKLLRERLESYTDDQLAILEDRQLDDPDELRKTWSSYLETREDGRLRSPPPWYAGGFGNPDHIADFDHWSKMPEFGVSEILCLSVGIEPEEFSEGRLAAYSKKQRHTELWPALNFLLRRHELFTRQFGSRVAADRFIIWVERIDLEMPPDFHRLMCEYHLPPHLKEKKLTKPAEPDKREIDKIAQLFTAMAIEFYGFDPKEDRSKIPTEIADLAATMGLDASTDTIRKYLRKGASFLPEDWQPE